MKHLLNKRSQKYLCQVSKPVVTDNVTDIGFSLAKPEPTCPVCEKHWKEYRELKPTPEWLVKT